MTTGYIISGDAGYLDSDGKWTQYDRPEEAFVHKHEQIVKGGDWAGQAIMVIWAEQYPEDGGRTQLIGKEVSFKDFMACEAALGKMKQL